MTYIPETLRQAREALLQSAAALHVIAQSLEGADEPASAPEPEPEPGKWRNDRPPKECETNDILRVWVWQSGAPVLVDCDLVPFWYESCPARNYWAPGNRPAPKSPPPDVVASQEVETQPDASLETGTPRTGGWIVDRVPDAKDSSDEARGLVRIPQRLGTPRRPPGDPLLIRHWSAVQLGQPWAPIGYRVDPWDPTCLDRNGWIRSRLPAVEDTKGVGVVLIPVGGGGTTTTIAYDLIVPGQPWAPWGSSPGRFEK